jgi:hypothetical protein
MSPKIYMTSLSIIILNNNEVRLLFLFLLGIDR